MATIDDWATKAAGQISQMFFHSRPTEPTVKDIAAIIAEHSPFKADVAYMPVPRCKTCVHWHHRGIRDYCEHPTLRLRASLLFIPPLETTKDFGCVQHEEKFGGDDIGDH
jgi:hypothetical protein